MHKRLSQHQEAVAAAKVALGVTPVVFDDAVRQIAALLERQWRGTTTEKRQAIADALAESSLIELARELSDAPTSKGGDMSQHPMSAAEPSATRGAVAQESRAVGEGE